MSDYDCITRQEAAAYISSKIYKVSVAALAKWAKNGTGPDYKLQGPGKGRALYSRAELDRWIKTEAFREPVKRHFNPLVLEPGAFAKAIR